MGGKGDKRIEPGQIRGRCAMEGGDSLLKQRRSDLMKMSFMLGDRGESDWGRRWGAEEGSMLFQLSHLS